MFGRRFNLLQIAGINIGLDLSWFIIAVLLSWSLATGYFPVVDANLTTLTYLWMGIAGMLGLFVCVLLHELGHALVARHFKLPISQITLFLFGGVAEIKKEPPSPYIEVLVSIAGPVVSVLLVIFMYLLTLACEAFGAPLAVIGVTKYLVLINIFIVVFNMIPAFPLDGGRVLRAALWAWKKNLSWAMNVSTALGAGFGFFLLFLGILLFLFGNLIAGFWLFILGLFLQNAADSSRKQYYIGREMRGVPVQKFMTKNPIKVPSDITLKEFIDQYVYESHHHLYPVVDGETLLGYISLKEIKQVSASLWETSLVRDHMVERSAFRTISPTMSALDALNLMQEFNTTTLLVVDSNRLVGIVTSQDLFKLISLKLELEAQE